jgi:hypothetical protein
MTPGLKVVRVGVADIAKIYVQDAYADMSIIYSKKRLLMIGENWLCKFK